MIPPRRRGYATDDLESIVDRLLSDPSAIRIWIRDGSNSGAPVPSLALEWVDILEACYEHETGHLPTFKDAAKLGFGIIVLVGGLAATGGTGILAAFGLGATVGSAILTSYETLKLTAKDAAALERLAALDQALYYLEQDMRDS